MPQLLIKLAGEPGECPCGCCGETMIVEVGLQLMTPEHVPVCCRCGRNEAPSLQSLIELATTAERIGKIAQHTPWLPLKAHLEMAHAAEKFAGSISTQRREAS